MGPKGLGLIRSALQAKGLSFANSDPGEEISGVKEEIFDSPTAWVASHIREYVESNG